MKISACYITKNEESNIRRSIESLLGQVDEIIVADTGSEDGTVAAAKSMGAQVYHYSWQDDFAAARNFALSKATGDWLILLDADEYFTEETAGNIRLLLDQVNDRCNCVFVQIVNWDKDKQEEQDRFYQLRLAKNMPGLAYKGAVHEWPNVNGEMIPNSTLVKPNILQIMHTGYSSSISRQKLLRNLDLLKKELAQTGNLGNLSRYLCSTYLDLGDVEKGLYYGWYYVRQGRQPVAYAGQCHRAMLNYYAGQKSRQAMEKRFELAEISAGQFPELPDFHAEYAECLFLQGRFQEAHDELQLALDLWRDYDDVEPCCLSEESRPIMEQRVRLFAQMAEQAAEISVSACLICRNEAVNMAGWLENAGCFADELIVVDTGSDDGTRELLAERGVKYFSYEWQDDFAAAKNFALDKAAGDWIVFLDADEVLKYPKGMKGNLLRLISRQPDMEAVSVPLENIDADNNNALICTDRVIRIFRHKPALRYAGAVHEQLVNVSEGAPVAAIASNVLFTVRHTGYSAGIMEKKLQRNLGLILQEMSAGNKEPYYGHLASCYYGLGAYQAALDYALLATQSPYQSADNKGEAYWIALEAMEALEYGLEDKLAVAEAALAVAGDIPDFYGYKGYLLAAGRQWKLAERYLSRAEALYAAQLNPDGLAVAGSSRYCQLASQFRTALARCHVKLGELLQGRQEYLQVLANNKWHEDALIYYLDSFGSRQGRIPEEAANAFENSYHETEDKKMLCDWLGRHGYQWQEAESLADAASVSGEPVAVHDLLADLAMQVQFLFVALLNVEPDFASHLVREQLKLLPESLVPLVYYFHGKRQGWGNVDMGWASPEGVSGEAYNSMLKAVQLWGTESVRERYEKIGEVLAGREEKVQ